MRVALLAGSYRPARACCRFVVLLPALSATRFSPPRPAFGLKVGELSGVVDTDSGVHLVLRTA